MDSIGVSQPSKSTIQFDFQTDFNVTIQISVSFVFFKALKFYIYVFKFFLKKMC